ncbi:hypothetical protein Avbf_17240, partial [Armadillidium vulgare]
MEFAIQYGCQASILLLFVPCLFIFP